MTLDLGCGRSCHPGAVGVDRHRGDARVVADVRRLPFRTGSVAAIWCSNVLEHFEHPERILDEAHRVLVPGGRLHVAVPHYSSPAAFHPQHRWYASLQVLRWWAQSEPPTGWRWRLCKLPEFVAADMGPRPWRLVSRRLAFLRPWRRLGVERLANVYPELWESYALGLAQPQCIEAELEALPEEVTT